MTPAPTPEFERLLDEFEVCVFATVSVIRESVERRDAARAALLEHVRGLVEDAARYRWLRGHAGEVHAANNLSWEARTDIFNHPDDAASLDAAIDASRKEQE